MGALEGLGGPVGTILDVGCARRGGCEFLPRAGGLCDEDGAASPCLGAKDVFGLPEDPVGP